MDTSDVVTIMIAFFSFVSAVFWFIINNIKSDIKDIKMYMRDLSCKISCLDKDLEIEKNRNRLKVEK